MLFRQELTDGEFFYMWDSMRNEFVIRVSPEVILELRSSHFVLKGIELVIEKED